MKIFLCILLHYFPYYEDIIDNTVLKRDADGCETADPSGIGAVTITSKPGPSILRKTDHNSNYCSGSVQSSGNRDSSQSKTNCQQVNSKEISHAEHSGNSLGRLNPIGHSLTHFRNENIVTERHNPIGQKISSNFQSRHPASSSYQSLSSGVGGVSSLEGFNAVREALLRTSNVIKDIDHLLEKKS